MRRRPALELFLNPTAIFPGETAGAAIRMLSKADTPCDAVTLTLVGTERRYDRTISSGNSSRRVYHECDVVRLAASFKGFRLTPGMHERHARFDIPSNAPPTYESNLTTISYELTARVSIPWWPDRVATYRLPVVMPPEVGAPQRGATRFTSHSAPKGKELFIEASLAREDLALGAQVEGAVSLANVAHHRIRRVQAALVEIETARVRSSAGPSETRRTTWTLHEGKPPESAELKFALKIPDAHAPDFSTPFITVSHQLRVVAEIAFGSDIHISIPIRLHRPRVDVAELHATPALLGRGKRKSNWGRALADLAPVAKVVRLDKETDELVLEHEGRSIHVTAEHRGKDGPHLVAEIEWPSLGLGLKLAERSWLDFGGRKGVSALEERFVIESREAEQARALFDAPTWRAILAFHNVGIDDTHGVVALPGSSHSVATLKGMLEKALALSDAISTANSRVPPPAILAGHLAAYRDFAARRGATLTPGDLSLGGMVVDGVCMALRHRFEQAVAKDSTLSIEVNAARDVLDALAKTAEKSVTRPVDATDDGVCVRIPLVEDPVSLEPMMDALAEAVRAIGAPRREGPYR